MSRPGLSSAVPRVLGGGSGGGDNGADSDSDIVIDCSRYSHGCFNTNLAVEHELEPSLNSHSLVECRSGLPPSSERSFQSCYLGRSKAMMRLTVQAKVYNFLERPTGWKCFIYHFSV